MRTIAIWRQAPGAVRTLLATMLLMNMGFYALVPYLSLYVTGSFGWSVALAGTMLGTRQLAEQGLTFLGGLLADRWSVKAILTAGLAIRSVGFLAFAACVETWQFFAAAILSGIGGALFGPAMQSMFARLSPERQRQSLFSFKNMISNIGIAASALIGSALSVFDFRYLSVVVGFVFVCLTWLAACKLPNAGREEPTASIRSDVGRILRDWPFVAYTAVTIGYYYLYMQLFLTIPMHVERVTGSPYAVAYVMCVVSLAVVSLQMTISARLRVVRNRFRAIAFGTATMGSGLLLLGYSSSMAAIGGSALLFALGSMIAAPLLPDIVPSFAPSRLLGSYYGFNGYSMAIGGALSTSLGGYAYDWGDRLGKPDLPWLLCMCVSLAVAAALFKFKDDRTARGRFH